MCDQEFPSMRALSNHMRRIHHTQIPQLDRLCEKAVEEAPAASYDTWSTVIRMGRRLLKCHLCGVKQCLFS